MKSLLLVSAIFFLNIPLLAAQDHSNLKNGFGAAGYDVVAYFQQNPTKGNKRITSEYEGVTYKFASEENKKTFEKNPKQYIPQYGGYCAYAIAKNGKKVGVNPKTYTITHGKLYLFYNSWGVNTLEKWNEEQPEVLRRKANSTWVALTKN
jgi:YHS domain-containing protein